MDAFYEQTKERVLHCGRKKGFYSEKNPDPGPGTLSTKEAIGNPEHQDFPIQKGKEKLMQASFMDAGGQAFTDMYGDYEGTLEQVLQMPMDNNHQRAVFVASLNAVLRHLRRIEGSIHCRDEEPVKCGKALVPYLKDRYSGARITQVGFQPRMVENLAAAHPLRVLDMDPDNIGTQKFGVTIESADNTKDAIGWADLLLVTGTTLANGSIRSLLDKKPIIFTEPPWRGRPLDGLGKILSL